MHLISQKYYKELIFVHNSIIYRGDLSFKMSEIDILYHGYDHKLYKEK